jgi:hypothetical protein
MSQEEQLRIKQKNYSEAIRYMDNAKETLQKASKDNNHYRDIKYVKTACGTAYNGVLLALDAYLRLKGIRKEKGRKSIEYYQEKIAGVDKKLLDTVNDAYKILHLWGYYDGIENAGVVQMGFDQAYTIINKIKPEPEV